VHVPCVDPARHTPCPILLDSAEVAAAREGRRGQVEGGKPEADFSPGGGVARKLEPATESSGELSGGVDLSCKCPGLSRSRSLSCERRDGRMGVCLKSLKEAAKREPVGARSGAEYDALYRRSGGRRERTPNRSPESMSGAPEGRHSKRSEFSEGSPAKRAKPGPGRRSGRGGADKADPPLGARGE
jgi:hypothetical protein